MWIEPHIGVLGDSHAQNSELEYNEPSPMMMRSPRGFHGRFARGLVLAAYLGTMVRALFERRLGSGSADSLLLTVIASAYREGRRPCAGGLSEFS